MSAARRSAVLDVCVDLVFHAVLVTALFFLFAGHSSPGGGFVGGLVAGCAFVLRYLVTSGAEAVGVLPVRPSVVLGTGLLLSAGTSAAPWLGGGQVLESGYRYVEVPLVGEVPLASVLVFDTGVFLVVVGVVLVVLATLGSRPEASLAGEGA